MNDFFIQTYDNFLPPFLHRQIIANYLDYGTQFSYMPSVAYHNHIHKDLRNSWNNYNDNIAEAASFNLRIDSGVNDNIQLEHNLKTFIYSRFNIKVKEITRMMLIYLPPDPNFHEGNILAPHVDILDREHLNLLYYLFDNDADTLFFDRLHDHINFSSTNDFHKVNLYKRVNVKQNRAVLFNGLIYHTGTVSKYNKRVTLNVNFIPEVTQIS